MPGVWEPRKNSEKEQEMNRRKFFKRLVTAIISLPIISMPLFLAKNKQFVLLEITGNGHHGKLINFDGTSDFVYLDGQTSRIRGFKRVLTHKEIQELYGQSRS